MGIGGSFWDLLKPYARNEGFDFLRNKRVAIDLSYWIVQHETAIKVHTRNPHLRLTFFRTINLFSKFGAYPVFVTDGTPSPLKAHARIMRFLQASNIDLSSLPIADGTSVKRNKAFVKCVQECVELLELFGMPVLKASGEAEGLCAQLNREGHIDACITSDSDAFLYGAKCIIKRLNPNSQEPFECYHISDIEAGLGLKRNHLIAIALLVGNDHDLKGVQGIGLETAFSFVKCFGENEVLERLHEIGSGKGLQLDESLNFEGDPGRNSDENTRKTRLSHCSFCGHPGSKRAHLKDSCERCSSSTSNKCVIKPVGFRCDCSSCDLDQKEKEEKKNKAWQMRICRKIATESNFPNDLIVQMYLNKNHGNFTDSEPLISWKCPNTELLIDYVAYQLNWEPVYIRQKLFPTLSTAFLRDVALNRKPDLLYGQYEFDSIHRTKIRFGHPFYVVIWKKSAQTTDNATAQTTDDANAIDRTPLDQLEIQENQVDVVNDLLGEPNVTNVRVDIGCLTADVTDVHVDDGCLMTDVHVDDGCLMTDVTDVLVDDGCLMTDENIELVNAAYPEKVAEFAQRKESKQSNSSKKTNESTPSPTKSKSVQLNITRFYRKAKQACLEKLSENLSDSEKDTSPPARKRSGAIPNLSKSVRRRLLFG